MKDEIKEILDYLKELDDNYIALEEQGASFKAFPNEKKAHILLDYITNLQESEAYYYGQYKDYKSRNEKAIEYMNNYIKVEESNEPVKIEFKVVRNILQGDDKK